MRALLLSALIAPATLAMVTVAPAPENALRATFEAQRDALTPLVRTNAARDFLGAIPHLPGVGEGRAVMYDASTNNAITLDEYAALDADDPARASYVRRPVDDSFYYRGLFGTPALYARAIDLASSHGLATLDEARVLDFGFGHTGQLRAMASLGAHCVGVEVSPFIEAMYSEAVDQGIVERHPGAAPGPAGSVRLLYGSFPGDEDLRARVGGRYDLIVSKNVLKRGYTHPEREADPSQLIDLGVDDETFVAALHDALAPGGLVVLYNFSPKQADDDEPYIPWADGRSPFDEGEWIAGGFEVLAFDVDDTDTALDHFVGVNPETREMLEGNLFGMYTVVRRPMDP